MTGDDYECFKDDPTDTTVWDSLVISTRMRGWTPDMQTNASSLLALLAQRQVPPASGPFVSTRPWPLTVLHQAPGPSPLAQLAAKARAGLPEGGSSQVQAAAPSMPTMSNKTTSNMVECSICCGPPMSRFGTGTINTPCGHCFHARCLSPWVVGAGNKGCPTCRRDISCLAPVLAAGQEQQTEAGR